MRVLGPSAAAVPLAVGLAAGGACNPRKDLGRRHIGSAAHRQARWRQFDQALSSVRLPLSLATT